LKNVFPKLANAGPLHESERIVLSNDRIFKADDVLSLTEPPDTGARRRSII